MKHDDPPARTPVALLLFVALGAGIAGGLVAHWIDGAAADASPEQASARGDAGDAAAVIAELRALTQAVQELVARPSSDAPASETARAPEPLRPDPNVALEGALTRLTDALANSGSGASAVADRSSMAIPLDPQAAHNRIDALLDRDGNEVKREHYFLTTRGIVERYGIPDTIEPNNGSVRMIYMAADGRGWQSFTTQDGVVIFYGRGK